MRLLGSRALSDCAHASSRQSRRLSYTLMTGQEKFAERSRLHLGIAPPIDPGRPDVTRVSSERTTYGSDRDILART